MKQRTVFVVFILLFLIHPIQSLRMEQRVMLAFFEIGFLIWIWFLFEKKQKKRAKEEAEWELNCNKRVIDILRQNRHDWLNHLQIIMGYITLKKVDQIPKYIEKIDEETKQRSLISSFENINLAVHLFVIPVHYSNIHIEIEIGEGFKEIEKEIDGNWVIGTTTKFLNLFQKSAELNQKDSHQLFIEAVPNNGDTPIFNFEFEGNISEVYQEMIKTGKQFELEGGQFLIDLYNDQEFIMELHFPSKQSRGVSHVCR